MIQLYQGVDIVEIPKFTSILLRNDTCVLDIFTEQERTYCQSRKEPYVHFAGRFAAKESFLKALGRGFSGPGIDHIFQEIEVVADGSGKPQLTVTGWAAKLTKKRKIQQMSVSISHSADYALASVILVGDR
ncbi:MAG TPA: holo-[acyl-carrier-protein] synthase [Nitrospiraceae bacterium]|jgi:holo-[acyl-carrier protein] synthase|nr:holo-[acyl-carrier-protein] synthase [Nitrospiraceae bacterium]